MDTDWTKYFHHQLPFFGLYHYRSSTATRIYLLVPFVHMNALIEISFLTVLSSHPLILTLYPPREGI